MSEPNDPVAPSRGSSTADPDYWRRKFAGQTRRVEEQRKKLEEQERQLTDLQGVLEQMRKSQEELQARMAQMVGQFEEQIKALAERAEAQERAARQAELKLQAERTVLEKFPALHKAYTAGDLKQREAFEDDAAFEAYLARMAQLVQSPASPELPAQPERPSPTGYVPSPSLTARPAGATQSVQGMYEELYRLDPRKPDEARRIKELYSLIDAASRRETPPSGS